ncbi:hypothetical protein Zm00014a_043291 [Zea mays]|nr:hypothetical protein Zm00014a_043291 [Zea mays]
MISPNSN